MTHDEMRDLVASHALDSVVGDEREFVEFHLEDCPHCRADLDAYRDVAAALGNSVAPLPEELWLGIVSRLDRSEEEPPKVPGLFPGSARWRSLRSGRGYRRGSNRTRFGLVASIAGAAAATAAIFSFGLGNNVAPPGGSALSSEGVVTALETPGHRLINLNDGNKRMVAQFVLANGRGYLVSWSLPALKVSETYQLWGLVSGQPISLGLLGQSPSQATFTLEGSTTPTQLRVTVEPSGGSVVPSGAVVASGLV